MYSKYTPSQAQFDHTINEIEKETSRSRLMLHSSHHRRLLVRKNHDMCTRKSVQLEIALYVLYCTYTHYIIASLDVW